MFYFYSRQLFWGFFVVHLSLFHYFLYENPWDSSSERIPNTYAKNNLLENNSISYQNAQKSYMSLCRVAESRDTVMGFPSLQRWPSVNCIYMCDTHTMVVNTYFVWVIHIFFHRDDCIYLYIKECLFHRITLINSTSTTFF